MTKIRDAVAPAVAAELEARSALPNPFTPSVVAKLTARAEQFLRQAQTKRRPRSGANEFAVNPLNNLRVAAAGVISDFYEDDLSSFGITQDRLDSLAAVPEGLDPRADAPRADLNVPLGDHGAKYNNIVHGAIMARDADRRNSGDPLLLPMPAGLTWVWSNALGILADAASDKVEAAAFERFASEVDGKGHEIKLMYEYVEFRIREAEGKSSRDVLVVGDTERKPEWLVAVESESARNKRDDAFERAGKSASDIGATQPRFHPKNVKDKVVDRSFRPGARVETYPNRGQDAYAKDDSLMWVKEPWDENNGATNENPSEGIDRLVSSQPKWTPASTEHLEAHPFAGTEQFEQQYGKAKSRPPTDPTAPRLSDLGAKVVAEDTAGEVGITLSQLQSSSRKRLVSTARKNWIVAFMGRGGTIAQAVEYTQRDKGYISKVCKEAGVAVPR